MGMTHGCNGTFGVERGVDSDSELLAHVRVLVEKAFAKPPPFDIREMPGGASKRRFFRVKLGSGASAVAMFVPDADKPDEIAKVDESQRRWPFLEVRELLEGRGIRVPKLLGEACDRGIILVEDLGDATLAAYLASAPGRKAAIYRRAVRDLAEAQRALAELPSESIVRARAFDYDLLRWELDHFVEWGIDARKIPLSGAERENFKAAFDWLASTITALPSGFVHRDYQSRNLMVRGSAPEEELVWIDFQDALLGPRVYDLVALLNDSYQEFDDAFVEARLTDYADVLGLSEGDRIAVRHEFSLVTVQRKLKDAGRFVFIQHNKGDASYVRFVEPTLRKVRNSLSRLSAESPMAMLDALLGRLSAPADA